MSATMEISRLTPRTREVLDAVIATGGQKPAARVLGISITAVEGHIFNAKCQTGSKSTLQLLVRYALATQVVVA